MHVHVHVHVHADAYMYSIHVVQSRLVAAGFLLTTRALHSNCVHMLVVRIPGIRSRSKLKRRAAGYLFFFCSILGQWLRNWHRNLITKIYPIHIMIYSFNNEPSKNNITKRQRLGRWWVTTIYQQFCAPPFLLERLWTSAKIVGSRQNNVLCIHDRHLAWT